MRRLVLLLALGLGLALPAVAPVLAQGADQTGFTSDFERCHKALAALIWRASPLSSTSSMGKRIWSE